MVAIFPNVCLCRRSLWSNLSGIDLEKLYRVEPLSYAITAYVVASYGPRFFSTVLKKFGQLARRFWQMVYRRPPPSQQLFRNASRETTTICPPSISYSYQIQTQLHSQRTKTHRGQMLLKYIYKTTPIHIR